MFNGKDPLQLSDARPQGSANTYNRQNVTCMRHSRYTAPLSTRPCHLSVCAQDLKVASNPNNRRHLLPTNSLSIQRRTRDHFQDSQSPDRRSLSKEHQQAIMNLCREAIATLSNTTNAREESQNNHSTLSNKTIRLYLTSMHASR